MRRLHFSFDTILLYVLVIAIFCFDGSVELSKYLHVISYIFIGVQILQGDWQKMPLKGYFSAYFPFIAFGFLSTILSVNHNLTFTRAFTMLQNYFLFVLLWLYVIRKEKQQDLLYAIAIGGGVFSVFIVSYYGGIASFIRIMQMADIGMRIGNDVAHLSRIGQSVCIAGVLTAFQLVNEKNKRRFVFFIIVLLLDLFVVMASKSRTGLALFALGLMMALFSTNISKNKKGLVAFIIGCAVIFIIILQTIDFSSVFVRWIRLFQSASLSQADASVNIRMNLILEGLAKFWERPLFGYGLATGTVISAYNTYFHNNYVELLATGGIVGFVCFYSIYYSFLRRLIKIRAEFIQKKRVLFLAIIQMIMMMTTVTYYSKYHNLLVVFFYTELYRIEQLLWSEKTDGRMMISKDKLGGITL